MVAVPVALHKPETQLEQPHYMHLLSEGFSPDEIAQLEVWGCRSMSASSANKLGIKKYDKGLKRHLNHDGGLWLEFDQSSGYGQIRFNTPLKTSDGKTYKYLSPARPARAWIPPTAKTWKQVEAITEGYKDAAMPTLRGCPTAAIVGTYNVIYSVPKGCGVPLIYDSDGWRKPQVMRALFLGSIWCDSRINLFPTMPQFPTGGACEFFKSGHTISDYQELVNTAYKPVDFLREWMTRWGDFDLETKLRCEAVALEVLRWMRQPDVVLQYLQAKKDDKTGQMPELIKGISDKHQDEPDRFLTTAIEVA